MLKFLTKQFYIDYQAFSEMEKKQYRPYIMVVVEIDNRLTVAIPFRSNISHNHVVWTDKANKRGIDLSKAVVITDKAKYIDATTSPQMRRSEFKAIKGKDAFIAQRMKTYIRRYKKAYKNRKEYYNNILCKYSTMQYFHKEIGL